MDHDPLRVNYYRLKIVDNDGRHSFSKILSVGYESSVSVSVQPNPFHESIQLFLGLEKDEIVYADIININGVRVATKSYKALKGTNQLSFPGLQQLKPGIYMLSIRNETGVLYQQKMIKQQH